MVAAPEISTSSSPESKPRKKMIENFSNSANDQIAIDLHQVSTVEATLPLPKKKVAVFSNTGPDQITKNLENSVIENMDEVVTEKKLLMQGKQRNETSVNLSSSSLKFQDAHSASPPLLSEIVKSSPADLFQIQSVSKIDVVHKSSTFQSNVLDSSQRPVLASEKRQKNGAAPVPKSAEETHSRLSKKTVPKIVTENKASEVIQFKQGAATNNVIRNPKKTVPVADKTIIDRPPKKMVKTVVKEAVSRPAKKMTDAADGKINPRVFSGDHIFQHPLPRAVRSAKKTFNSSASSVTLSGASPKDRPPLPPSHTEGAGARRALPPTTATFSHDLHSPRGRGPVGAGQATIVLC